MPPPKYRKLTEALRRRINAMPVGSAVSSERDLAAEFEVSRMTARRALLELVDEGLLERHVGRGTFVAVPRMNVHLSLRSFTEDMIARGKKPGSVVLRFEETNADLDSAFPDETPLVVVHRVRTAEELPVAMEYSHLDAEMVPGLCVSDAEGSLYEVFRGRYGIRFTNGEQSIVAQECPESIGHFLGVAENSPVLRMDRVAYVGDRLIEHTRSWYRGDIYQLKATLRLGG